MKGGILSLARGMTKTRAYRYAQGEMETWETFKRICEEKGLAKGRTH